MERSEALQASVDVEGDQLAVDGATTVSPEMNGAVAAAEPTPAQKLGSLLGEFDVGLALLPVSAHGVGVDVANLDAAAGLFNDCGHVKASIAEALETERVERVRAMWVGC